MGVIGDKSTFFTRKRINIETSAACLLSCKYCGRQTDPGFHDRKKNWSRLEFDDYKKLVAYFDDLHFCGGYSDPVMSNFIIDYLEYTHLQGKKSVLHTAVSHRSMEWYEEIFRKAPSAKWIFGIDGLPKDSHKYRTGQDGEKLFEVAKMAAKMGIDTHWQYIVFSYNENDIEEAKQLAKDNSITFTILRSSRWSGPTDPLRPSKQFQNKHYLGRKLENLNYIQPRCFGVTKWYYTGEGYLIPCCYMNREALYKQSGLDVEKYALRNVEKVEDIIYSNYMKSFADEIEKNSSPLTVDRKNSNLPRPCWNTCKATSVPYDKLELFDD